MNYKQTINDLLMEVAKLRKDAEYLKGELGYWKQQAQRNDSVASGCDTDNRKKFIEEIMRNVAAEVTNGGVEIHGAIPIEDSLKSAMQRVDDLLTDDEPEFIQIAEKDKFDSREKLKNDVREYSNKHIYPHGDVIEFRCQVFDWLDRQAAITEREYFETKCHDCQDAHDRQTYKNIERYAKLKEKVDNLRASEEINNKLIAQLLDSDVEKNRRIVEYAEKVDTLEAENATLREKLSQALDHAHSISKLGELD